MEFYFDFLSPYSYLAFQWIKKNKILIESLGISVVYKPVTMAKVIHSNDTKGPAEIESKRNYLFRDCLRFASVNQIPFNAPRSLPFNSLYSLRVVAAASPDDKFKVIDAIFSAGWGEGQDIGEEDVLKNILKGQSLDESLLEMTTSKEIRRELKSTTNEAISKQVFGVPTFIYKEELFWGNDSTKYLELALAGKDPIDSQKYNNFLKEHPFNQG